jgi:DNA-binding FrmR family transcriptional regulator
MSEFCVKCSDKEGQLELLRKQLYESQQECVKLQTQIEALTLDLAFYGGNMINLSCNNK